MSRQRDFFDDEEERGKARSTDPITSHIAADAVTVTVLQRKYIEALEAAHPTPQTTTEIGRYHSMSRDSFSPRSKRLIELGIIEECGTRIVPNDSTGKMQKMKAYRLRKPPTNGS